MLEATREGKRVVYLDSAASTPMPTSVALRWEEGARAHFANVHRGHHALAEEATAAYDGARARIARFVGAAPQSVVLVRNATEALNLVARGLRLVADDVVLTTTAEHHSNLVPWQRAATVRFLEAPLDGPLDVATVTGALRALRPAVLAIHHASNVTGVVQPVAELCHAARDLGVVTVVDAAQSAPHLALDVEELGADFLAFSGHKMLGPKGIGVLVGRPGMLARLDPLSVGGGAVQTVTRDGFVLRPPPEGLEAGTPNVPGALGLAAAMDFLDEVGHDAMAAHGRRLAAALRAATAELPVQRVLTSAGGDGLPIASLVLRPGGIDAGRLAIALSDVYGVMVRSGLQCAHPLFAGLDAPDGAIRVSAYLYNDEDDITRFAEACGALLRRFGR